MYGSKNPKEIWDVILIKFDKLVISKLVETKTNSNCLIGYLDIVIRQLVLILPKMSGYVTTFKVKDEDKNENNNSMCFRIDDEKLLEKY